MARAQPVVPLEAFAADTPAADADARDDDVALGCECACPWLQFEAWDPVPVPQAGAPAC